MKFMISSDVQERGTFIYSAHEMKSWAVILLSHMKNRLPQFIDSQYLSSFQNYKGYKG